MAASTQDMIDQLLAQTTVAPQPSFLGVQAPPDQGQLKNLLGKLQQQQFMQQQQQQTPGEFGFLHDAGRAGMAGVGQQLGNIAQQALAPPPAAPAQSPQASMLMQARAKYANDVAQGVPENAARQSAAKALVQAGFPAAPEVLEKAVTAGISNAHLQGETAHNTAQAISDLQLAQTHRPLEEQNWVRERDQADRRLGIEQQNADTSKDKADKVPNPNDVSPAGIQAMVDYKLTTGKDPVGAARAGLAVPYWNALAARLKATGDDVGASNAAAQGYKAAGKSLSQTTQTLANTQSAGLQIEKNINSLDPIIQRLGGPGSPLMQKALNQWNQGLVGDKDTAQAIFYINELQSELGRVASNSFGNAHLSDSAKADAKELINKSMIGTGSFEGVKAAARQSYQNKLASLAETKQGLMGQLSQNANGSPFGQQQPPASPPQAPPPQTFQEGQTATGPSGKIVFKGGTWVPAQ